MRLVTFFSSGTPRAGVVREDKVHAITNFSTVREALADPSAIVWDKVAAVSLPEADLLPPVLDPHKIICVGLNYDEHREESQRPKADYPTLFARWTNSHVGHGKALKRPAESHLFDYEGELAVVIGKPGRRIAKADALSHIAGYSCYNDGSLRDWQFHASQYTPGKNFDASGSFGPWIVVNEIPDPSKLVLKTILNGVVVQESGTDALIFDVPTLIAYISSFTELETGDVIITGTPGGVGHRRVPPVYMKPGDTVEIEISGIGTLRNTVEAG